jgi:hypothetical protein
VNLGGRRIILSRCAEQTQNITDISTNSTDILTNSIEIFKNINDILTLFGAAAKSEARRGGVWGAQRQSWT